MTWDKRYRVRSLICHFPSWPPKEIAPEINNYLFLTNCYHIITNIHEAGKQISHYVRTTKIQLLWATDYLRYLIPKFTFRFKTHLWTNGAPLHVPPQRKISVLHSVLRMSTKTQLTSRTFLTFQSPLLPPMPRPPLLQICGSLHALIISGAQPHQRLNENPLDIFIHVLSDPSREHPQCNQTGFPFRQAMLFQQTTLTCVLRSLRWMTPSLGCLFVLHFHVVQHLHVFPLNQAGSSVLSVTKRMLEMT